MSRPTKTVFLYPVGILPWQGLAVPVSRRQDSIPQEHSREGKARSAKLNLSPPHSAHSHTHDRKEGKQRTGLEVIMTEHIHTPVTVGMLKSKGKQ